MKIGATDTLLQPRSSSDTFTPGRSLLQATSGRYYYEYLASLNPAVLAWVQLRKCISGSLVEFTQHKWSAFHLHDNGPGELSDIFRDELILTDFDLDGQHGCELRPLPDQLIQRALAQRASWFILTNTPQRLQALRAMSENTPEPKRSLTVSPISYGPQGEAADFKDWGYITRFSPFTQSRDTLIRDGMYSWIGKTWRSILCFAPMPDSSGSFDALWTSLSCHMLTVIPRNLRFADPEYQLLASRVLLKAVGELKIPGLDDPELIAFARDYYRRNICVALGVQENNLQLFAQHLDQGVRCFRLYTVATDERLSHQVKRITQRICERSNSEDPIEFFVGQITSLEQVLDLQNSLSPEEWKCIDGFYIGNGGGVRCKTAETGMIVNTPELLLKLREHVGTRHKSIVVEGGVGDEPAVALLFGADGLSHAEGISGASIEAPNGGLFLFDGKEYWSPQRGESSPATKMVEASVGLRDKRLYDDGEPKQVEGVGGLIRQDARFVSMCGRVRIRSEWLAQCFVKLGVKTMEQLHTLGTAITHPELERIFDLKWHDLQRYGDVRLLQPDGPNGEQLYTIPLPVQRRTAAMRSVASSIGGREIDVGPLSFKQLQE